MTIEYRMVNAAFRSLGALQKMVDEEAAGGRVVHGAGPFYIFLGREPGVPRTHQVARVLFRSAQWTHSLADNEARSGWTLATVGPSFAVFTKPPGEVEPAPVRYRVRDIALMTPGGIKALLDREGRDGWMVRGLTAGAAVLVKPTAGADPVVHELEGTLLRTAGMTQRLLDERAAAGWRLACASRLFLVFSRLAPE
jgi:hypothetical protein